MCWACRERRDQQWIFGVLYALASADFVDTSSQSDWGVCPPWWCHHPNRQLLCFLQGKGHSPATQYHFVIGNRRDRTRAFEQFTVITITIIITIIIIIRIFLWRKAVPEVLSQKDATRNGVSEPFLGISVTNPVSYRIFGHSMLSGNLF
jgi:hypothetical protein